MKSLVFLSFNASSVCKLVVDITTGFDEKNMLSNEIWNLTSEEIDFIKKNRLKNDWPLLCCLNRIKISMSFSRI